MKVSMLFFRFSVLSVTLFASCAKDDGNTDYRPLPAVKSVVVTASGDSLAMIGKVNEFRLLAGDPLSSAPGATSGRREVNWDGVPAAFTNNNNFPFDFIGSADPAVGNGRKRGLILTSASTSFRTDSSLFAGIDAS